MDKKFRYTDHFSTQINKRGIDRNLVDNTVKNPQQKIKDKDDIKRDVCQSIITNKKGKQKIIRVVIEEKENEIVIITAYMSSKISKYWSKNENQI